MANPLLFDRELLIRRRSRAARRALDHDFLLRRAAEEIGGRLYGILREFPVALNLGAHHGVLTGVLAQNSATGRIISADNCAALLSRCQGQKVLCSEEALPFRNESLDLVVSALALHFVNDLPGALIQIRRVLKPDGLFIGALLGGDTLRELRETLLAAEIETGGGASPRVAPMADVRDYGALLQRAGFALPVADTDRVTITYPTLFALMRELRGMGASNVLHQRSRTPLPRAALLRAAELYLERFPAGDGRVKATFELIYLTGWAPHVSQQKPLKPGSALMRLAEALGASELPAGDKAAFPRKN